MFNTPRSISSDSRRDEGSEGRTLLVMLDEIAGHQETKSLVKLVTEGILVTPSVRSFYGVSTN